jgi:hypothetical protein
MDASIFKRLDELFDGFIDPLFAFIDKSCVQYQTL